MNKNQIKVFCLNADENTSYYVHVCIRGLHLDWDPAGPAGLKANLTEVGGLNFAAGGSESGQ